MDFTKILKRSLAITLRYRALWLFGFLLALAGGGGRGFNPGGGSSSSGGVGSGGGPSGPYVGGPQWSDISRAWPIILAILIAVLVFIALLIITLSILQALARTAIIGMVDEIEKTEQTSVRSGFRILWSRQGLRLFLMELLTTIAWIIVAPTMIITALLPLVLIATGNVVLIVAGVLAAVILFLVAIAILTVAGIAFSMLMEIARRECVLGDKGVLESLRGGIITLRYYLADVGVIWLLMTGISLGWSILLIPAGIAFVILGLFIGGLPALVAFALSRSWIPAAVIGAPLFLIAIIVPFTFVEGVFLVFQSSVWTLTYREIRAREIAATHDGSPPVSPEAEPGPA
ncbi:MAG: hypothetical protein NUW24_09770 [Anaerolineae bacterium]|jgi:hypothetical protein|nr:hypothetical protein [Anaerolineae bacterium]MDH7474840.1 hypothetical protein [Anaerolineae bacterium]